MSRHLIRNGFVITLEPENPIAGMADVLIEDGIVAKVGKEISAEKCDVITDAGGKLVLPGMVNMHMHLYSSLARGMATSGPAPSNFSEILEKLWWKLDLGLDEESIYWSAVVGLLDGLRSGVTTVFDHHASFGVIDGSLDIMEKACRDVGIRACLCFEISDRNGEASSKASINENIRFIKKHGECDKNEDDMIRAMFGLHASYTCSDKTLQAVAEADASKHGVHVHVAEDLADVRFNVAEYGSRTVKRLQTCGMLGHKTLAVHCVHVDSKEREILKETGTTVVHNPESNMGNAVGCSDIVGMAEEGITLALGTDGFTADMIHSLRTANIIHKHNRKDPRVGFMEALNMLTKTNPDLTARYFKNPSGRITPGNHGDVVIMDYNPPTPLTVNTLGGHFIFGLQYGRVDTVITGGREVFKNGSSTLLDERVVAEKARECAGRLWKLM